jgi:hypothetical protein
LPGRRELLVSESSSVSSDWTEMREQLKQHLMDHYSAPEDQIDSFLERQCTDETSCRRLMRQYAMIDDDDDDE